MSLETPAFFLSIASLCLALLIVSEQIIVRRTLKEKEIRDIKNTINGMITDIQITNQALNEFLTSLSKDTSPKPIDIEMTHQRYQKLVDEINSVWAKLHVYHDEYSVRVKSSVFNMKYPFTELINLMKRGAYDSLIPHTEDIEKLCRPFTTLQYNVVPMDDSVGLAANP